MTRSVYVSVIGQEDNIGDSLLRRGLLWALRGPGIRPHVYVGGSTEGYCSGLGLAPEDVVYRSQHEWMRAFRKDVASFTRPAFVLNAGEKRAERGQTYISGRRWGQMLISRALGGAIIQTGVGLRAASASEVDPAAARRLRIVSPLTWRDEPSRDAAGRGAVFPDWAFSSGVVSSSGREATPTKRNLLAVSMRGDRAMPTEGWYDAVRGLATDLKADVVVLNQVKRDEERAREIARVLGAEVDIWRGDVHADREREVRDIYARSRGVISDRLHALIVGATEGAVPLGLSVGSPEKLQRTLDVVGMAGACMSAESGSVDLIRATMGRTVTSMNVHELSLVAARRLEDLRRGMLEAIGA